MGERARGFEKSSSAGVHIDNVSPLLVNSDCGLVCFFAASISGIHEEFDDIVKGVFLVVPEDNTELIFHHRIGRGLESEISFACWDGWFVGGIIKSIQDKVEGVGHRLSHGLLQFWRHRLIRFWLWV